jgi:hypothetical protein
MNIPINGNPSDANRWCKAADEGAQRYQKAVKSLLAVRVIYIGLMGKTTSGRKIS